MYLAGLTERVGLDNESATGGSSSGSIQGPDGGLRESLAPACAIDQTVYALSNDRPLVTNDIHDCVNEFGERGTTWIGMISHRFPDRVRRQPIKSLFAWFAPSRSCRLPIRNASGSRARGQFEWLLWAEGRGVSSGFHVSFYRRAILRPDALLDERISIGEGDR